MVGLLVLLSLSTLNFSSSGSGGSGSGNKHNYIYIAIVGAAVVLGVISWAVTTWWIDGDSLQMATGLIRRQNIRVPLSRIQAVDLVQSWLARVFGLAEVRVRTGGGSRADARLMYLKIDDADRVRSSLLALAHGLSDTTPAPPEWPLVSSRTTASWARCCCPERHFGAHRRRNAHRPCCVGQDRCHRAQRRWQHALGLPVRHRKELDREGGVRVGFPCCGSSRRLPDPMRLALPDRRDSPGRRVQSVRMLEPLWWRPLGWCRLELHLAGGVHKGHSQGGGGTVRRALLPVGTRAEAEMLLGRVLPNFAVPLSRPPARAFWKAPFSYHFLAAGHSDYYAAGVRGRLRRLTEWAPLAKAQSIRWKQGPLQRSLGLASVHLDIAGRRAALSWLDRSAEEADTMMAMLPVLCAADRERETALARTRSHSAAGRRSPRPDGSATGGGAASGGDASPPSGPGRDDRCRPDSNGSAAGALGFACLGGCSSVGRAPALQAGGRRFEPGQLHKPKSLLRGYLLLSVE